MADMQITAGFRRKTRYNLAFLGVLKTQSKACSSFCIPRLVCLGYHNTSESGLSGLKAFQVGKPSQGMDVLTIFEKAQYFDRR